ncbi:hypothetical protein K466DRAFT_315697 [Polyporus arcularius HHB13444]|uniref:Uncharacterized protein n=1 Tax=Polyporus arcularius HHB13444 TaxID=1314778 RepID=A0A5C3NX76_9APHY|nr:hypothetical protein K466DRAFT_315697 [Polyporus arcularius HHB13444]
MATPCRRCSAADATGSRLVRIARPASLSAGGGAPVTPLTGTMTAASRPAQGWRRRHSRQYRCAVDIYVRRAVPRQELEWRRCGCGHTGVLPVTVLSLLFVVCSLSTGWRWYVDPRPQASGEPESASGYPNALFLPILDRRQSTPFRPLRAQAITSRLTSGGRPPGRNRQPTIRTVEGSTSL